MNLAALPCPDCGARQTGNRRDHALSCPLILGLEAAGVSDLDWFARHPYAGSFRRKAVAAELSFARWLLGPIFESRGIRVLARRDGSRSYAGIHFSPLPTTNGNAG